LARPAYNERMASTPRSLTDSPWFWAYLFATAALIALALIAPKYAERQADIERQFQGRQRAAQQAQGQEPNVELSTAERTLITLQPLFITLAAVTIIAWIIVWHRRRLPTPDPRHPSTVPSACPGSTNNR
jgi:hypothetical protein